MIFAFLKYLQPVHYFSLTRAQGDSIFPDVRFLPSSVLSNLEADGNYLSATAKAYDLSWQALHKGYLGHEKTYRSFEPLPLEDNYRFIRRYFSRFWVLYVLFIRLFSFKNPYLELKAWTKTKSTQRSCYLDCPIVYSDWADFNSTLINTKPLVSVIIPTLNRYLFLKDALQDLEQQDYMNFEVLVVDQSDPYDSSFYDAFSLDMQVIRQEEKALWLARNTAIKHAKGHYLLLFDDDSRVSPDWIRQHLKALDFFKADLSSGVSISKVGAEVPAHYAFFRISDQLDTGNVMIKKEVFKTLGLFDRQFEKQRMGDGEFGLRAYLYGYLNVSNPYAKRLHLKVETGGLRQMGSWDAFRPNSIFKPRPIPSVLYFFRRYFGNSQSRWAILRTLPFSVVPYRFKKNKPFMVLGIVFSILMLPLLILQVYRSWRLSSVKLKQGPLLETLRG